MRWTGQAKRMDNETAKKNMARRVWYTKKRKTRLRWRDRQPQQTPEEFWQEQPQMGALCRRHTSLEGTLTEEATCDTVSTPQGIKRKKRTHG